MIRYYYWQRSTPLGQSQHWAVHRQVELTSILISEKRMQQKSIARWPRSDATICPFYLQQRIWQCGGHWVLLGWPISERKHLLLELLLLVYNASSQAIICIVAIMLIALGHSWETRIKLSSSEMQQRRETAIQIPIVSRPCICCCRWAENQNVSLSVCSWKAQAGEEKETGDNFPTAKWHKTARFKFFAKFSLTSNTVHEHHCREVIADEAHTFYCTWSFFASERKKTHFQRKGG